MRWALIVNGLVDNIIEADYRGAQQIAGTMECKAANVDLLPVGIGDAYANGRFTRNGVTIEQRLSDVEKIVLLGQEITDRELEAIEQGQQNTDLELRLLVLEAK